jgi:hypothetical protein
MQMMVKARRHQQHLLAVALNEVLRHTTKSSYAPRTAPPFVQQPHVIASVSQVERQTTGMDDKR